jgi:hypothetical protein
MRHYEIVKADGTIDPDMTKDVPEFATDLNGAVDAFLGKRTALTEVSSPEVDEAKFVNPTTGEEVWLCRVQGATE